MKSDYLKEQCHQVEEKWNEECLNRRCEWHTAYAKKEAELAQVRHDKEHDKQLAPPIAGAIRHIVIGFVVWFILASIFRSMNAFLLDVLSFAFLGWWIIFGNVNCFKAGYPRITLPEILKMHKNYDKVIAEYEQWLREAESRRESDIADIYATCEREKQQEIEQTKRDFTERLRNELQRMQNSQYPMQISRIVMPEVQQMLSAHSFQHESLTLSAQACEKELVLTTSSGMRKVYGYSSCGLSNVPDIHQRIVLATLVGKQLQLQIVKFEPTAHTSVDQNDEYVSVSM